MRRGKPTLMSKLCFIPLNEIDDQGRSFSFDSYEAMGGDPKSLDLLQFSCKVRIHRAGDGYYINGNIDFKRALPCTLCGKESSYTQKLKIEEFLRVDPSFDTSEIEVAKSDESNSLVIRSSQWNFMEFIRESILLEEPVQFYSHDGSTSAQSCPEYENLVKQGILASDDENKGSNAFEALKNLRL